MKPFTLFYFILSIILYFIALPYLLFLSFKQKYKNSIPSRFFLFNNSKFDYEDGIWFHICSLGEAKAIKPILDMLEIYKDKSVSVSTITQTGYAEASKYKASVRYLPYEMFLVFWIRRQKVLIVLEAEFWFMLFVMAKSKGTRIILLNARMPDKSVDKYIRFSWFYKRVLENVEIIYAQSQNDKDNFLKLCNKEIKVIGNIKLASKISHNKEYVKPKIQCIVAGSTHESEENAILLAFTNYIKVKNSKLILVPRHPERFDDVYKLVSKICSKHNLSFSRFSKCNNFKSDVILIDKMGELNNIYNIGDIAILGGAFIDGIGGHNPLEPAFFGCKIIVGKYYFHQKELFKYVSNVQSVEIDKIYEALLKTDSLAISSVDQNIDLDAVVKQILKEEK